VWCKVVRFHSSVQFHLYSVFVLLADCHEWSAAPIRPSPPAYAVCHAAAFAVNAALAVSNGSIAREPFPWTHPSTPTRGWTGRKHRFSGLLNDLTTSRSLPVLEARAHPTVPRSRLITLQPYVKKVDIPYSGGLSNLEAPVTGGVSMTSPCSLNRVTTFLQPTRQKLLFTLVAMVQINAPWLCHGVIESPSYYLMCWWALQWSFQG